MFISTPLVGLAANERRTKHHNKAAKGGRLFVWMGQLERLEDDIVLVGLLIAFCEFLCWVVVFVVFMLRLPLVMEMV